MTEKNGTWTPKKIIAAVAGILALLGAGGTGIYGLDIGGAGQAQIEKEKAQEEKDRAQDKRLDKCESKIDEVYREVVKNGKGIERLLERTK